MSNRNAYLPRGEADQTSMFIASLHSNGCAETQDEACMSLHDTLEYVETLSYQLSRIARHSDQRLLGYLLMLSAEEARCAKIRLSETGN